MERLSDDYNWSFRLTGRKIEALNLGSYNYLGFAENTGVCAQTAIQTAKKYAVGNCSPRQELGKLILA
jgi:serine palmitoyltransferase